MCTSPNIRFRLKKGVSPDTLIGVSSYFQIRSLKQLQSYFPSYSAFKLYFDANMDYQYIPCRKCEECKADYSKQWAIRCAHEFQIRKIGCFITFTIDTLKVPLFLEEKNLKKYCKRCEKGNRYIKYPIDYTLCKGMFLDELKRIRDYIFKHYGISVRYFGCGEYGSKDQRPHYHLLLFGYSFPDKKFIETSSKGVPLYFSEELQKLWKYGIVKIQDVNYRACMYCAKYCMKKITFSNDISKQEYYYGREPEFLVMSKGNCQVNRCPYIDEIIKKCKGMKSLRDLNNPYCKNCKFTRGGIGYDWFSRYWRDVLQIGYCTIEGIKVSIPKYYLEILKLTNKEEYDKYKIKQLNAIDDIKEERSIEKLTIRKKINKSRLKLQQRQ